jgi:hypothetical protein
VDNPAPATGERMGGRGSGRQPTEMDMVGRPAEGVAQANPGRARPRGGPRAGDEPAEVAVCAGRREKPLRACGAGSCPYRKPTPVGRGEHPEVDERSSVKELGKLTP